MAWDVVVVVVLHVLSIIACVVPRHCSHEARYVYVGVEVVRKLHLKHFP
jgi:hypothetical protein